MNRTSIALSLAAAAALSACVTQEPVTPVATAVQTPTTVVTTQPALVATPVQVVQPGTQAVVVPGAPVAVVQPGGAQLVATIRPGVGRVTSINKLSEASSPGYEPLRRIGLAMNDGTAQFVDTRAARLVVGDYVEITADSQIRYPVSSANPRY
jgi:hypothetical protein